MIPNSPVSPYGWQWSPVHVHNYTFPTTLNDKHRHEVIGVMAPAAGALDAHTHFYQGITTLVDGHTHRYCGTSGPAVPCPEGGHRHELCGQTSFDDGHNHNYNGFTGPGRSWR